MRKYKYNNKELPLFNKDFDQEKERLQKLSRKRSNRKYYLKQKRFWKKIEEEAQQEQERLEKEKYWKEWSDTQTRISKKLDEDIAKFNKECRENPNGFKL